MSSFYFSRFFRTAYNRTFLEYLTSYRIERAEELLRQTDIPVREIAPRVGYTDANYFTKVFKRHCGCTPTDYRSRLCLPRKGKTTEKHCAEYTKRRTQIFRLPSFSLSYCKYLRYYPFCPLIYNRRWKDE